MKITTAKAIPKSLQDDGTVLSQPIALAKSVEKYIKIQGDIDNYYELSSYAHLIGTMIACDGIAVFSSDGSLMAYNVFFRSTTSNPTLGGARHRTYDGLCSLVDQGELTAAFILSSDGHSKFYARKNDGKF